MVSKKNLLKEEVKKLEGRMDTWLKFRLKKLVSP